MPRNRYLQALLLLAGLAIVTYSLISLYLPSSRWLIFGIDKRSGRVRLAEQSVTFEKMTEGLGLGRNLGFTLVAKRRFRRPS